MCIRVGKEQEKIVSKYHYKRAFIVRSYLQDDWFPGSGLLDKFLAVIEYQICTLTCACVLGKENEKTVIIFRLYRGYILSF